VERIRQFDNLFITAGLTQSKIPGESLLTSITFTENHQVKS